MNDDGMGERENNDILIQASQSVDGCWEINESKYYRSELQVY